MFVLRQSPYGHQHTGHRDELKQCKTYSRRDSHVVTHRSTNRPVRCLSSGERTGSSVFTDLWPYVLVLVLNNVNICLTHICRRYGS